MSSYAATGGVAEDFAETWAAYHFKGDWASLVVDGNPYIYYQGFPARTPADAQRQNLMDSAITAFRSAVK